MVNIRKLLKRYNENIELIQYETDNGVVHREDGPAEIFSDGLIAWRRNNILHRLDGPACYWILEPFDMEDQTTWKYDFSKSEYFEWMIDGKDITKEVINWMNSNRIYLPMSDEEIVLFKITFN